MAGVGISICRYIGGHPIRGKAGISSQSDMLQKIITIQAVQYAKSSLTFK